MKLLIIDEEFPYPLNTGKRIRSFHLARVLGQLHNVSYMAYGSENSSGYDFMRENLLNPVAVTPPDRRQSGPMFYWKLLLNLISRYPYIVTSHYTARFMNRLAALVAAEKFDCIICEWTPYAIFIKNLPNIKKIIVAHNIESAIWKGYLSNERNLLRKYYIATQIKKVIRFEDSCFGWADGATAVSSGDADEIRKLKISYPVEVIDNGVDVNYFYPQDAAVNPDSLVFTGSMDWRPNQDAAIYFAHEIFPLVKKERSSIRATFVGRNPSRKVKELENINGITVTGTVDDVRPYIAQASVYIVPLRIGGGSRLKILEAMAMGKPVVSTTIGAEGLRVSDGKNICLRDTPEAFAKEVVHLLDDRKARDILGENGRRTVEQQYRWEELGRKLSEYVCRILSSR